MRVAVLGAGYAGVTLARRLEDALPDAASLVVVDETGHHLLQHELHRVIRRPELAAELRLPLENLLDCEIVRDRVTDVDPEAGVATLAAEAPATDGAHDTDGAPDTDGASATDGGGSGDGDTLDYDVGAVCLGAATDDHDIPGVAEHGTPCKRIEHARTIREGFESVLEREGRTVVGGAGLSGIQIAGELAALANEHGAALADEREGSPDGERDATVEVVLLEQADSVAPGFDADFQRTIDAALEKRGVTVRTGATVSGADADGVVLDDGERLGCEQLVWTGGIRGPDALDGERPTVRSDLRVGGDTFVVGDAGRVVDARGTAVPASAQAATRQARVAARNVRALVEHRLAGGEDFSPRLDRYAFDAPGWIVSVGDGAVAQVNGRVLTGRAALALKTSVGAGYLGSVGAAASALDLVRAELGLGGGENRAENGAGDGAEGSTDGSGAERSSTEHDAEGRTDESGADRTADESAHDGEAS